MTGKRFTLSSVGFTDEAILHDEDVPIGNWNVHRKEIVDLLNELHEGKEQLQSRINDYDVALKTLQDLTERKLKENEQLKERNNRQAKRLVELYELMAKKDWESLTAIIDDFCSCEEQLQREWKCYE